MPQQQLPFVLKKSDTMGNEIAEDVGHLFEVGFNIGILAYIRQHEEDFSHHLDNLYIDDLRKLHFPVIAKSMLKRARIIAQWNRHIVQQWLMFFLQRGFLAGINFFDEYLQMLRGQGTGKTVEIAYYQCSFCGSNSAHTNPRDEKEERLEILAQFAHLGLDPEAVDIDAHSRQGRFLHADTLMLLRCEKRWRVLCVDLSAFSIKSSSSLKDPNNAEALRRHLLGELSYIRSKSVFTNLSIDTETANLGPTIASGLERYFMAFNREDKESVKLIQAASYAYDFYGFLKKHGLLQEEDAVIFNVAGFTDRSLNTMTVNGDTLKLLETCAAIYQRHVHRVEIQEKRAQVLETIRANAARSFQQGEIFTRDLVAAAEREDGIHWVPVHRERIDGFTCSLAPLPLEQLEPELIARIGQERARAIDIRDAHKDLIEQALAGPATYLFLTGNPGIGKTTAIVRFLQDHADEGFLFFYVSPRKQVNLDIIQKFREEDTGKFGGDVFAITSNSAIIRNNRGRQTVYYYSDAIRGDFVKQGTRERLSFQDASIEERERLLSGSPRLEQIQEDLFWDKGESVSGVLDSICNALYVNMKEPLSNNVIATIAIQSLKKTRDGGDTLKHLDKIFQGAYLSREGRVVPEKIGEIANRMKHVFIMIDEVTGDESGVEFLSGINRFVRRYGLTQPEMGFNAKIIVADASIVDSQVIQQHLAKTAYEPDRIYFRHIPQTAKLPPLSLEEFPFHGQSAVAINANTYPAACLHITYNVCMEFLKYDEETFAQLKDQLPDEVQKKILEDILGILEQPDAGQTIVYIQDKRRLLRLIEGIRKTLSAFEKNQDYLEIHANISESDKEQIHKHRDRVKVIFMTASASRGLSFPKVRHILVDIPHFEIEQNLMEIIQVIYRGRGTFEEGVPRTYDREEKELRFYLSDRAVYYGDDAEERRLTLRESALNLLNILLVLKTSVMTRISGCGTVGFERFMMIPIGGKSVLAAGGTFTDVMEKLIRELRREYSRSPADKWLREVYTILEQLLGQGDFRLTEPKAKPGEGDRLGQTSYLSMRTSFAKSFANAAYDSFDKLLDWQPLQRGYIAGGLLIVPFDGKYLHERYLMRLDQGLREGTEGLLSKLYSMSKNRDYPESLRVAMRDAIDLVRQLNSAPVHKTQQFMLGSQNPDQYYALPLVAFMYEDVLKDYFIRGDEEPEDSTFRDVLAEYMRALYPVSTVLPIGDRYREFPFIVFRCFSLQEARRKLFTDSYLFTSNELNVLNMLLSAKE